MFPVIASFAGFSLSSFGLFLLLAFLAGFFVIWRIIRLYDIDPEKIIDLFIFVFLGSILGARVYFVLTHLHLFADIYQFLDIYKHPGLAFWGAFVGGVISLLIVCRRLKLRLWQTADILMPAFFIGLALGSIGCLLGSCEYGLTTDLPIGIKQAGIIGNRLPIQILQFLLALAVFWYLWKSILRFHFDGQIVGMGLIMLGLIKLILEPFRTPQFLVLNFSISYIFAFFLIFSGIWIVYSRTKKSIKQDLAYSANLITHSSKRKQALLSLKKWWYNLYVLMSIRLTRGKRSLFKFLNVKSNPTKF